MQVSALTPGFGAEITGADLSDASPALAATCFDLFDKHAVCVFRDSGLDDAHHVAFSRLFGDLEMAPRINAVGSTPRFALPELFDAGNLDREGRIVTDERRRLINLGNQQWHTDSSFRLARSSYSMLLARMEHDMPDPGPVRRPT